MTEKNKIDPLISEFLDCRTNVEKIRVLQKHRQEWTKDHLIMMQSSLEIISEEEESIDVHFKNLQRVLEMKKRYEEPWTG